MAQKRRKVYTSIDHQPLRFAVDDVFAQVLAMGEKAVAAGG
jgi:hypothetical protein